MSRNHNNDVEDIGDRRNKNERKERPKDLSVLPPSGTSLHKRRRGEPPASITVKTPQTPTEDSYSPCATGIIEESCWNSSDMYYPDPETICEKMLEILKDRDDLLAQRGKEIATKTKETVDAFDELEKLLELLDQLVSYKLRNDRILQKLKDVNDLKKLFDARKNLEIENERLLSETRELELINEALDAKSENDYGQIIFDSILPGGRIKRSGSKWKSHTKFGGSLLRKPRSRSAGGDESDASPSVSHRRRSDGIFIKDVEKSKVSKWTRVKSAFRWEKAQWPPNTLAGAAGVFAAGAMVGAVALAGSNPPSTPGISVTTSSSFPPAASSAFLPSNSGMPLTTSASASAALVNPERDSASLTPGSAMSLTPNSSCEELRINSGIHRKSIHEDNYLHAPIQDDSSTSPSPNKLHKSPWNKMRDIIQTRRDSVKKKSTRGSKSSPDVVPTRRRSLSDGGDSDAPPALTLTIPSSEELESDPHPLLRKQRSLELGARPPQHRPPRASKWTKVKRAFLTSASVSVPSSPSRHSAFFTDADTEGVSSGCEAGAVQDEIARDYAALQLRLGREISDRREKLPSAKRPVATEEQLSADFRKKLNEWQRMKGARQPPPVPARQDLSEDFLRKWDAWNRMKKTNSVPAWEEGAKPDQVLVQTSTGLFKFQGISRSFTRKLHEWEKSRGIAPEASTSALLRAARAQSKVSAAPLTRTQSDGSVAPSASGSGRLHASSLSVNDADDFESEYEREHYQHSLEGVDECDGSNTRGAVIVEVEDEEVCTAAPLMAVSPRHTPQKPVYTYGPAEARLLCETSAAVTGTAVLQPNTSVSETRTAIKEETGTTVKQSRVEAFPLERSNRKHVMRQPSIEEDALFIRKTIEEIERGCSSHLKEIEDKGLRVIDDFINREKEEDVSHKRKENNIVTVRGSFIKQNSMEEILDDAKRKDGNGKKKMKSRARLEREQSKPSETDTEPEVDTVTVEFPRRKKRPRKASEKPPTSFQCDSDGEVYVLKLRAPEVRDRSPEVIVKTTRKIFSPVVRSGESLPSAVIPVDVEDLAEVRPSTCNKTQSITDTKRKITSRAERKKEYTRSRSSGDLQDGEEQRTRSRPPLPLSPSSQRKPQPKETAPSIRIMIQRYNMKINEEGHTSGASSGASSPAWRSPTAERRRPLDMPVGVNIRNNPFLEREVQKSASACQLSRRDQTSVEKHLTPSSSINLEGVLKSHSANALHPEEKGEGSSPQTEHKKVQDSQETIKCTTESTDTIVPIVTKDPLVKTEEPSVYMPILRQFSDTVVPSSSKIVENYVIERSFSSGESPYANNVTVAAKLSERAARIKAARDKFLFSAPSMRREGTSSTSDLRPGDRSSRISYESDVTESQSPAVKQINLGRSPSNLGRSASTGMVNVEREAWQRVADGQRRDRPRSRFSLSRLAAKFRRKDESSIAKLCRQSLLVQLKKQ